MIDTDDARDYAEERAVRAEADAENRAEQAHADLVTETVRRLRDLGTTAYEDAPETIGNLVGDVHLRLAPNVHRYELLARQQHLAHLAATVAAVIEETGEYDLDKVARGVIGGYRDTHTARVPADLMNRALSSAAGRVLGAVAEVANYVRQAEADREVEEHERDLLVQARAAGLEL